MYQKYCICGLEINHPELTEVHIDYDPSLLGTNLYDNTYMFTNDRATECPINNCWIYAADCVTALTAPMDTFITMGAADPWAIQVIKITQPGYSFDDVCYKCTNGEQSIDRILKIR